MIDAGTILEVARKLIGNTEPTAMLNWASDNVGGEHPADAFRDAFEKCLKWNA